MIYTVVVLVFAPRSALRSIVKDNILYDLIKPKKTFTQCYRKVVKTVENVCSIATLWDTVHHNIILCRGSLQSSLFAML